MMFWQVVILVFSLQTASIEAISMTSVQLCQTYSSYDTNADGKITKSSPNEMEPLFYYLTSDMSMKDSQREAFVSMLMANMGDEMHYFHVAQQVKMLKNRLSEFAAGEVTATYLFSYYDSNANAPIIYDSYDHEGQQSMTTWYNIVNGVDDLHIEFPTGISTVAALKTYLETNVQGV